MVRANHILYGRQDPQWTKPPKWEKEMKTSQPTNTTTAPKPEAAPNPGTQAEIKGAQQAPMGS